MYKNIALVFICTITFSVHANIDKAAVKKDLQQASDLFSELSSGKPIYSIEKMTGGASLSGLYKVKSGNQSYILRVLDPNRHKQNVTHEIEISKLLGDIGVSPKVFGASIEKASFLMEEIKGETLFKSKLTEDELIILANQIRKIHEQQPTSIDRKETAKDVIERIIRVDLPFTLPVEYQKALIKLEPHFKELSKNPKYALIHPDLNPGNMIRTKDSIKIFDWESVTISHPYLNLATILFFYDLNDSEKELLLETYTQGKYKIDEQELNSAFKVIQYLYALNLLGISFRSIPITGKKPAIKDYEKIRAMIADRRWDTLAPQLGDPNVAYTISQFLLEEVAKK